MLVGEVFFVLSLGWKQGRTPEFAYYRYFWGNKLIERGLLYGGLFGCKKKWLLLFFRAPRTY